jgi:hypothetical protein
VVVALDPGRARIAALVSVTPTAHGVALVCVTGEQARGFCCGPTEPAQFEFKVVATLEASQKVAASSEMKRPTARETR